MVEKIKKYKNVSFSYDNFKCDKCDVSICENENGCYAFVKTENDELVLKVNNKALILIEEEKF